MSKIFSIVMLAAALVWVLAGCGTGSGSPAASSTAPAANETKLDDAGLVKLFNGKTVAPLYRSISETDTEKAYEEFGKSFEPGFDLKIVYYDTLSDGLLMLRNRQADVLDVMNYTGRYLAQRNDDLAVYMYENWRGTTPMIFSPDKQAALNKVNAAIRAMKEDGTLTRLVDTWITNLPVGEEPAGGPMPVIEGAETIRMGLSGDEPPLDYIAADGQPGGFNVAALSEISRRANINFKLITVTGNARFAALQSGKIDAFFWHNATAATEGNSDSGTKILKLGYYSLVMSESYLDSYSAEVVLK